jgi:hypothetical protein
MRSIICILVLALLGTGVAAGEKGTTDTMQRMDQNGPDAAQVLEARHSTLFYSRIW